VPIDDEPDPPLVEGARPWLISCDESGIDGAKYYGYGSLWMSWDRRGEFVADIHALAVEHDMKLGVVDERAHEFKWNKVKVQKLGFYKALVEYFFRKPWLMFHCIVVRRALVNREMHDGGYLQARQKHFVMLLTNKIDRALRKNRRRKFRVWVDPLEGSKKAHEAVEVISNNVLNKKFGKLKPVDKVIVRTSHDTPSIQLCDLLLCAVMSAWQGEVTAPGKVQLQRYVAEHLGWMDLHADTKFAERKFNVWYFFDPTSGEEREVATRDVVLKFPLYPPSTR
jgi:hypothetical protein